MDEEVEDLRSEKFQKTLKFVVGFLGWFAINTLVYALINLGGRTRYLGYDIILWAFVLLVNLVMLTVLATLKKTRWIALGVLSALAVNFAVSILFLSASDAYCFIPVTYPVYPSRPSGIFARPTPFKARTAVPVNKKPIGFHDGNEGTVGSNNCVAFGWTTDPDNRKSDLFVRVLADGEEVTKVIAGAYRPDLNVPNGCPGGTCGFSIDLKYLITTNEEHFIQVQAQDAQTGEWTSLSNSPKKLECYK